MTQQSSNDVYPIGTQGQKWGEAEVKQWQQAQQVKRSYKDLVLAELPGCEANFDIVKYGALPMDEQRYPLYLLKSKNYDSDKPSVLVTGGVHGYETSGVLGAIRFASSIESNYLDSFNVFIAPCISPWGFETINRWNINAIDPNRSFYQNSPAPESALIMQAISELDVPFIAHIDLHETTDTDNSEFRPALAAREGIIQDNWNIPDGFYLVGDTDNPEPEFQKAMIACVEKVTHIAPPDENGQIIGAPLEQHGVINYDTKKLGLCAGFTSAAFVTTTEVYPDSPKVDGENCILAQVAAVHGGLDYLKSVIAN